jgi:hypothetical protein
MELPTALATERMWLEPSEAAESVWRATSQLFQSKYCAAMAAEQLQKSLEELMLYCSFEEDGRQLWPI